MDKAAKSASQAGADYTALKELFRPHVESFDSFLDVGLDEMLRSIRPMEIKDPNSSTILKNILHA
jgi:DNA-directed RNA polymerase I subunit RPA2